MQTFDNCALAPLHRPHVEEIRYHVFNWEALALAAIKNGYKKPNLQYTNSKNIKIKEPSENLFNGV